MGKKNSEAGCLIAFFLIIALIFVLIIIGMVSGSIKDLEETKHEGKLIEEGKTKTHNEVINEIVEILKNKDEDKLKGYLTEDFYIFR